MGHTSTAMPGLRYSDRRKLAESGTLGDLSHEVVPDELAQALRVIAESGTMSDSAFEARLNRELRIKRIPQLTFEYDPTAVEAVRMTKLIEELAPEDEDEDRDES